MRTSSRLRAKRKPSQPANRLEDYLQYVAAQWLRDNKIAFCHIPNEGRRSRRHAARLLAMGLRPGAHDLIIALPGPTTLWVELKTENGKLSTHQRNWHAELKKVSHHQAQIQTDSARDLLVELERLVLAHVPAHCQIHICLCATTYPLDKLQSSWASQENQQVKT